ncbi:hypothetical protein [Dinoroseobacter sp. S124A]|uniref:hypothetical protein n=1 Tax=Dinoroseobacter sp. S124A TaxID=3415128 RepID=UPI003C7CF433
MKPFPLIGALLLGLLPLAAQAAPVFYSDRTSFTNDANPNGSENFEGETAGTTFENTPLNTGFMTLTGGPIPIYPDQGEANIIAPGGSCSDNSDPNGSNYVCAYADVFSSMRVDFVAPVTAWGADFRDIGDGSRSTTVDFLDSDDAVIASYEFTNKGEGQAFFFGAVLEDDAAMSLVFRATAPKQQTTDLYGFDNVLFTVPRDVPPVPPVPLPASFVLLLSALAGGAGFSRLRRARTA